MAFNYTLKFIEGEKTNEVGYQFLIKKLEIADEICHGQPMSAGGAPQAMSLKGMLEKIYPTVTVQVWFQGNQVF
jgi:hypothetical protein